MALVRNASARLHIVSSEKERGSMKILNYSDELRISSLEWFFIFWFLCLVVLVLRLDGLDVSLGYWPTITIPFTDSEIHRISMAARAIHFINGKQWPVCCVWQQLQTGGPSGNQSHSRRIQYRFSFVRRVEFSVSNHKIGCVQCASWFMNEQFECRREIDQLRSSWFYWFRDVDGRPPQNHQHKWYANREFNWIVSRGNLYPLHTWTWTLGRGTSSHRSIDKYNCFIQLKIRLTDDWCTSGLIDCHRAARRLHGVQSTDTHSLTDLNIREIDFNWIWICRFRSQLTRIHRHISTSKTFSFAPSVPLSPSRCQFQSATKLWCVN